MNPTGWVWGALAAHAVNTLSVVNGPCCPHGCAPCQALQILHDDGALGDTLAPYVAASGGDWDWWNPDPKSGPDIPGIGKIGSFRWEWVTERWCDPNTCEENK